MHKVPVLACLTVLLMSPLTYAGDAGNKSVSNDADVTLTTAVKEALVESGIAKRGQVQVETQNRIVQLSGFVDSEATQELALQAAKGIEGVESVRNDLVVQPSKPSLSEAKDDSVIEARVRKQLQQTSDVPSPNDINVEVKEGVVQLSGFVASLDEKNRAADVVASIAGVKDVRNDIALQR